jgi:hypothetical protein
MAEYIVSAGTTPSAAEILEEMIADYQARMPGWLPNEGDPATVLMAVYALRHSVLLSVMQQVKAQIYTDFGESIAGVPFRDASFATVDATVTIGAAFVGEPHEIPAGLRVQIEGPEGPAGFQVSETVNTVAGENTAAVVLRAEEAGAGGSGLTGEVQLVDPREWIQAITLLSETAGGQDAQSEDDYRDRLVRKERRDSPTIITADDAEEAALEIPGVGRCLILNNYVPAEGETPAKEGVPGAFTAVLLDPDGANVSGSIKAEALALITGERLLDLIGHVIDPTRTPIAVAYTFTVNPGWDSASVGAAADAAVTQYLSPAVWGNVSTAGGITTWEDDLLVRYGELYAVLNNVQGLNHVTALTINGVAHVDAVLAGPGALPNLTSVVGTPA